MKKILVLKILVLKNLVLKILVLINFSVKKLSGKNIGVKNNSPLYGSFAGPKNAGPNIIYISICDILGLPFNLL